MAKRLVILASAFLLATALVSCGKGVGYSDQAAGSAPMGLAESGDPAPKMADMPRKIIYTGEASLVCEDLDKAADRLEGMVKQFGGYVGNANRFGARGETRRGSWTIRIPSSQFDPFLKSLPSLGELQSSSRTAQDVSEEYYDVQARLNNKRVEEARLLTLLKNDTGKLTDVLTVEKELNRVREEAERIEGRLRFLSHQTEMSSITVSLKEVKGYIPEGPPSLSTRVGRAFSGSLDSLKETATSVLLVGVALLPWLIPIGVVGWIVRAVIKRQRKAHPPIV